MKIDITEELQNYLDAKGRMPVLAVAKQLRLHKK